VTGDANNPYLPPKAKVSDVTSDAPLIRPLAVTIALYLIGARVLMGVAVFVNAVIDARGHFMLMGLLSTAFSVAVMGTLSVFIARGRNWARIVYLVLTLFSLVSLAFTIANIYNVPAGVSMRGALWGWWLFTLLAPSALAVAVVALLFGPGRAWFAPRE
jgi:hypothetical protein